jgi:hypothetical protein
MGTEPVPETSYLNELTRLCAREDCIEKNRPGYDEITSKTLKACASLISYQLIPLFYIPVPQRISESTFACVVTGAAERTHGNSIALNQKIIRL